MLIQLQSKRLITAREIANLKCHTLRTVQLAILLLLFTVISVHGQTSEGTKRNLGFEQTTVGMPVGWRTGGVGDYALSIDSTAARSGKYAGFIGYKEGDVGFGSWTATLPDNYLGKAITLSGYIKTENVTDGFAGLWMRIDPEIAFDNMGKRGITGTTDWTAYQVTLRLNPDRTEQIVFGGMLRGKGKMWIDDLRITIDGKDLSEVKTYQRKIYPAETDTAFNRGSAVIFPELKTQLVDNLELLGKLWGLLKYHHPEICRGNYNWDYELFRFLPEYLKATSSKQRDKLLVQWINKFGVIPACTSCQPTPDDAILKPDYSWLQKTDAGKELTSKVKELYTHRYQGEQYYISLDPYVHNPQFLNENRYSTMHYPDQGFRLLALYRYWNMIQYFYPYRHLTDKDWNTVLKEYIPIFINAQNQLEYELATLQLIGEIDDTHAAYFWADQIDSLKGQNYAPFGVKWIENKWVVSEHFDSDMPESTNLQVGDVITHIKGIPVEAIIDSVEKYYPASNHASKMRDIANDLLRSNQPTLDIQFIRNDQPAKTTLVLHPNAGQNRAHDNNEKCYKIVDGNIGYIALNTIKNGDMPIIKEILKNTKAIIIDIRKGKADFFPYSLETFFFSQYTPYAKFTSGNVNNPGEFHYVIESKVPKSNNSYQGKLIVLVNENVQSAGETLAMTFKAVPHSTIVGSTTSGANGNVSTIWLPGGLRTTISGIGVYYPDGTVMQRIGIVPDVFISPSIEGIKSGKDEVLEKAIEWIDK